MRGVTDVIDLAAERLDIPLFALHGLPRLTLTGRRQLLVERHRGLTRYDPDCVELAVTGGRVRLCGAQLRLIAMDREAVLLSGEIRSLEFLERSEH